MRFVTILLTVLFAAAAHAEQERPTNVTVQEYLAVQQDIRAGFEQGKPRRLNRSEWRRFDAAQARLRTLLADVEHTDQLKMDKRLALFNIQEEIEALLKGNDDDRLICRSERPTGSNIGQRRCRTVAEMREYREAAQEAIRRLPQTLRTGESP
jgi:hypothetical protein